MRVSDRVLECESYMFISLMVVFDSKTSPGNNSVDGKLASFGEFGKC